MYGIGEGGGGGGVKAITRTASAVKKQVFWYAHLTLLEQQGCFPKPDVSNLPFKKKLQDLPLQVFTKTVEEGIIVA